MNIYHISAYGDTESPTMWNYDEEVLYVKIISFLYFACGIKHINEQPACVESAIKHYCQSLCTILQNEKEGCLHGSVVMATQQPLSSPTINQEIKMESSQNESTLLSADECQDGISVWLISSVWSRDAWFAFDSTRYGRPIQMIHPKPIRTDRFH